MATVCPNRSLKLLADDSILIGKGGFGQVYGPCAWNDKRCAIKKRLFTIDEECKEEQIPYEKEQEACKKWMSLHHRNLVTVYDVKFESPALYILMEYGDGGSLKKVLEKRLCVLPVDVLTDWGIQIAEGMAYLHRNNIVHRDLKSLNIIMMEADAATNPYGKTLKIIDFDQIRESDRSAAMSNAGTFAWMAPEVLESGYFSKVSDVWSYGVVLWEMTKGEVPYKGTSEPAIVSGIINRTCKLEVPNSCPSVIKIVLESCLQYDKRKRPTFDLILAMLQNSPEGQEEKMLMKEKDTVSIESITNMSNESVEEMEPETYPANTDTMDEGIKSVIKETKPIRQSLIDGLDLDARHMGKPVTLFQKMKRLFSPSGSTKSKTSMKTKAHSANKSDERIENHREFLEDRIDPDCGLLEKLLAQRTLSRKEISEIRAQSSLYNRNTQLLNYILEKHQGVRLIEALRDTEQIHVVNYLNGNGEYDPEYGEEWPLTETEITILDTNEKSLIDLLDLSVLLGLLHSVKVVNKWQLDLISSKPTTQSKIVALLDILHRCSLHNYLQTIRCLHQSKQGHIAQVFESGGVIVGVHAHLNGPLDKVTAAEDEIVTKIESLLSCTLIPENRILEILQMRLIAAQKGQSIVLYIWCETEVELLRLYDWLTSGRLKDNVEQVFNQLLTSSQKTAVKKITLSEEELLCMKTYLTVDENHVPESEVPESEMKPVVEEGEGEQKEIEVDETQVPESKIPESELTEADYSKKEEPMTIEDINAAILRNNNDFFSQHLKLKGVINKLHAEDILSDEDTRYIKTLDHASDKIDEILNVVRNSTTEAYNTFVSFLRKSGQILVADVAEKGGVVLKIKVTHETSENLEELEKEIVEKLNQLRDKSVRKSEEVWRFLSQLKRGNIEIVSSQQEKGVVIWCWCRSQLALRIFEELSASEVKQPNLLNCLFNLLLPEKSVPAMSSVYLENYEEEIVCREPRSFSTESVKCFTINEQPAFGVAILQAKICLLCRSPNAIVVYDEGDLTKPCDELSLNDVVTLMDMAYSKESNCLYITDEGRRSVWKIAFPSPGNKVDLWLDAGAGDPFTLSVTNDGRVVMVKRGPPSCLEIYHPDARLLFHLDLPSPIVKPNHAVETSKGNLVVAYDKDFGIQGGICEITKEGQLISRFDSMFEAINGVGENVNTILARLAKAKFIGFNYLAIDDNDEVYVCDSVNGELAVFDSRFFMLENGKSGLNAVHRVHYFKEQMQFVVLHGSQKDQVSVLALE